jgi:hypothetical protein
MTTEQLTEYGQELVAAGFEVWFTQTWGGGYLQYRDPATGACGSLQHGSEGWQHLMPIPPSREFGSSMHLDKPSPPFTVEAAKECARPFNRNGIVGRQPNAGDRTWRSDKAVRIGPTITTAVVT